MTTATRPIRSVLVLDDDADYLDLCERELLPREVRVAGGIPSALMLAREHSFDIALIDVLLTSRLNVTSKDRIALGFDAVKILRAEFPELIIVLVTEGYALAFAKKGRSVGANATVPKQFFSPKKIVAVIDEGKLAELERSCMPRDESLARNAYEHLARVYTNHDFNVSETCDALEISRSTFYRKLRERGER